MTDSFYCNCYVFEYLPLVIYRIITKNKAKSPASIDITILMKRMSRVKICGAATQHNIKEIIRRCSVAISARKQVVIDLSDTCAIDARFLGFLLMLRSSVARHGGQSSIGGIVAKRTETVSLERRRLPSPIGGSAGARSRTKELVRVEDTVPEKIVSGALGRLS